MLRLAGRKGWLVGGGSNQKGAKTYQGRICALSLVVGILGGSTRHGLVLRASFWPFLASSVLDEGRRWAVVVKESHRGPVMVASAEMWYIRVGPRKKMVG